MKSPDRKKHSAKITFMDQYPGEEGPHRVTVFVKAPGIKKQAVARIYQGVDGKTGEKTYYAVDDEGLHAIFSTREKLSSLKKDFVAFAKTFAEIAIAQQEKLQAVKNRQAEKTTGQRVKELNDLRENRKHSKERGISR